MGQLLVVGRKSSPSTSWGRLISSGGIIFPHLLFSIISIYKKNAPNNPGAFMGFFLFSTVFSVIWPVICFKFTVNWPLITGFSRKSPSESQKRKILWKIKILPRLNTKTTNIPESNPSTRISSSLGSHYRHT